MLKAAVAKKSSPETQTTPLATKGPATTKKKRSIKVKNKPHRRTRPSDAKVRALHIRLQATSTLEERRAIYVECGHHPVALTRWFRSMGLERIALQPSVQTQGPDSPRKTVAQGTKPAEKTQDAPRSDISSKKFKLVAGLSLQSRETAIELLAALLTG